MSDPQTESWHHEVRVLLQGFSKILWNHLYDSIMKIYYQETKSVLLLFAMMINDDEKK